MLGWQLVFGQERGKPFIRNYTTKEYKGDFQNWAILQNSKGIIYVGNQEGVLEFDGVHWRKIPMPNQSGVRSLAINSGDTIFVGAFDEFGYISAEANGKLNYSSYIPLLADSIGFLGDIWTTEFLNGEAYFQTDEYIFRIKGDELTCWEPDSIGFFMLLNVNDTMFIQDAYTGLKYVDGDSLKFIKNGDRVSGIMLHSMHELRDSMYIFANSTYGAVLYDKKLGEFYRYGAKSAKFMRNNISYISHQINDTTFAFGTSRKGIIVIDKFGEILNRFDKSMGMQSETVYDLHYSDQGVLLAGLDDGISKIEFQSSVAFWDNANGLHGAVLDVKHYNDKFYVATNYGTFYLESCMDLHACYLDQFIELEGVKAQSWKFVEFKGADFKKLLMISTDGLYIIEDTSATRILNIGIAGYNIVQSKKIKNKIWTTDAEGIKLATFDSEKNEWSSTDYLFNLRDQMRSLVEDDEGNIWVGANLKGVYKIIHPFDEERMQIVFYDTTSGLKQDIEYMVYEYEGKILVSNKNGIFEYNKKLDKFVAFKLGNDYKAERSNILAFDKDGGICVEGRVYYKKISEGDYERIAAPFSRVPDILTELLHIDDSGKIWIGNNDGLFQVDINKDRSYDQDFYTLIRKVSIKHDSAIFYGAAQSEFPKFKPEVKYDFNDIIIEFAAPFFENEEKLFYQYKLDGFDEEWSQWSKDTKKEYTYLREGSYLFKVKAQNQYGNESNIAYFAFNISPPWYRTLIAYLSYFVIFILLVRLFLLLRTRQLIHEKRNLEKIVLERTTEILQQKEEILAQAENLRAANENIVDQNTQLENQKKEILRQAEELLQNNIELEKLSLIARETDNAVSVFDNSGKLEWFNEGFTRMYGYTFDEFVEERGRSLVEYSRNQNIKTDIQECIENKKTIIYEFFTLTKTDEGIWAQTTLTPIVDENGVTSKLVAIDANITKIKDAERQILYQKEEIEQKSKQLERINKELEKLSIVASETDNAIMLMDPKGNIEWINDGFNRMYGYTYEQLIEEKDRNIIGASTSLNIKDLIQVWFGDKEPIIYESLNTTKEGKKIWAQTTLTPIIDVNGEIKMLIAIDTDITKLKAAEEEIEKQRDELEIANATKDKFFSIIAHDLRGPFSNFVTLTKIISDSFDQFDSNQLKNYMSEIQNSAQSTYNLLENLLDWSRSQKGNIKFDPVKTDVNQIVLENIELLNNIAAKKEIDLIYNSVDNILAIADTEMLKTVIRNLISNAIKFTKAKGTIEINLKEGKTYHTVSVKDNGIGIKKEDINKLFRIDIHHTTIGTKKEKGTGLGLILCKEFVERNGGKIWVESEIGQGTKFEFTVPIYKIKKSKK